VSDPAFVICSDDSSGGAEGQRNDAELAQNLVTVRHVKRRAFNLDSEVLRDPGLL
jgi:hypothetical protein